MLSVLMGWAAGIAGATVLIIFTIFLLLLLFGRVLELVQFILVVRLQILLVHLSFGVRGFFHSLCFLELLLFLELSHLLSSSGTHSVFLLGALLLSTLVDCLGGAFDRAFHERFCCTFDGAADIFILSFKRAAVFLAHK